MNQKLDAGTDTDTGTDTGTDRNHNRNHNLDLDALATKLYCARQSGQAILRLSLDASFNGEQAYQICDRGIELREKEGEKIIGAKMGLTSSAKREQMNLHSPIYGVLTDKMQLPCGGTFDLQNPKGYPAIHPKIEPEIFFITGRDLCAPVTRQQAAEGCAKVGAALEILDSRYRDFKYFSLEDVIADNSSSSLFVLANANEILPFDQIDVSNLAMKMTVRHLNQSQEIVEEGNSRAISGDPLISVVQLCELLGQRGKILPAGSIVLTGAATPAVSLRTGMSINLEVEKLGSVSLHLANALAEKRPG